jgi:hypothetical protein
VDRRGRGLLVGCARARFPGCRLLLGSGKLARRLIRAAFRGSFQMRLRLLLPAVLLAVLAAPSASAAAKKKVEPALPQAMAQVTDTAVDASTLDPQHQVAEAYLNALTGKGADQGRETLLGGATMTARIFQLENWKVTGREKHRHEVGELSDVNALIDALDREGRTALGKMMSGGGGGDDVSMHEFSADEAKKILQPTKAKAALLTRTHPVFAYFARVDKEVYWHPKNPFREVLAKAGAKGKYSLDLDLLWITTEEGLAEKTARKWPLRVVRFVSDGVDTGYKILPASDWNAE